MSNQSFLDQPFAFVIAQGPPIAGGKGDAQPLGTPAANGTAAVPGVPGGTGGPAPAGPGFGMLMPFVFVLVFMIGFSWWTQSKERKKRVAMLSSISRSDRVQTLGGIIGTVVEMRDDEVVLRVDEATNTKITFSKSAIQGVMKKARESEAAAAA
jgi:preprotein translocase subunit YajC